MKLEKEEGEPSCLKKQAWVYSYFILLFPVDFKDVIKSKIASLLTFLS